MIRFGGEDLQVYLYRDPIDMRKYAPRSDMQSGRRRSGLPVEGGGVSAAHNASCALQASASPGACRALGSAPS